jgi:hypothetical protein
LEWSQTVNHFRRCRSWCIHFSSIAPRTHFRRYQSCCVQFSSFVILNSFSTVGLLCLVFTLCAPTLILTVPKEFRPIFKFCYVILIFLQFRCHCVHFLHFKLHNYFLAIAALLRVIFILVILDSFSTVSGSLRHVFIFCAPALIFAQFRGRCVHFSRFMLLDSFLAVKEQCAHFSFFALYKLILHWY